MSVKIRPLDDRILVKQNAAEEKTAGGIVLPDTAKEKPQRGKVIAAGPGKMLNDATPNESKKGTGFMVNTGHGSEVDLRSCIIAKMTF